MVDLMLLEDKKYEQLLTRRPNLSTRSKSELKLKTEADIQTESAINKNITISKLRYNRLKSDKSSQGLDKKFYDNRKSLTSRIGYQEVSKMTDSKSPAKSKSRSITPTGHKYNERDSSTPTSITPREKSDRKTHNSSQEDLSPRIERPPEKSDRDEPKYNRKRFIAQSRERSSQVFFGNNHPVQSIPQEVVEDEVVVFNPNLTSESLVIQEYILRNLNDFDRKFSPNNYYQLFDDRKWSIQSLLKRIYFILRVLDLIKKLTDVIEKNSVKKSVSFNLNTEFEKYATSRFDLYNHLGFLLEKFSNIRDTDFAYSNEVSITIIQMKMRSFKEIVFEAKIAGSNLDKEIKPHVLKDSVFISDQNQKERKIVDFYISILNEMNEIIDISMNSSTVFDHILNKGIETGIYKSQFEFHPILIKLWKNLEMNIGRYDSLYEKIDRYLFTAVQLMRSKLYFHQNKERFSEFLVLEGFQDYSKELSTLLLKNIFNNSDISSKHYDSMQSKFKILLWNLSLLKAVEKIEIENTEKLIKAIKLTDFANKNLRIIYSERKTVSDIGFSYALNNILHSTIQSIELIISQIVELEEKYETKFQFLKKCIEDIDSFRMKMEDLNHQYNSFLKAEFEKIEINYKEMCDKITYFSMSIDSISKIFVNNNNVPSESIIEHVQSTYMICRAALMAKEKLFEFKEMFNHIKFNTFIQDSENKIELDELINKLNEKLLTLFTSPLEVELNKIDKIVLKGSYLDILLRTLEFFVEKNITEEFVDVTSTNFEEKVERIKNKALLLLQEYEKPIEYLEELQNPFQSSQKRLRNLVKFIEDFLLFNRKKNSLIRAFSEEHAKNFDNNHDMRSLFQKYKIEIKKAFENFKIDFLFEYQKYELSMKQVMKKIIFVTEKEIQIFEGIDKISIKGHKMLQKFDNELYQKFPECWKIFEERDEKRPEIMLAISWRSNFENYQKEVRLLLNHEKGVLLPDYEFTLTFLINYFETKKNSLEGITRHFEFKNKFNLEIIRQYLSFQQPKLKDNWKKIIEITLILKSHYFAQENSDYKEKNYSKNLFLMHYTFQEYFKHIVDILEQLLEFQKLPHFFFNKDFTTAEILDSIIQLLKQVDITRNNISSNLNSSKNSQKYALIKNLSDSFLETFIKSYMTEYIDLSEKAKHLDFMESYITKNEDLLDLEILIHDGDFVHHREHTLIELSGKIKKIQLDLQQSLNNPYFEDNAFLISNLKKYIEKFVQYQEKIHENLDLAREFMHEKDDLEYFIDKTSSGFDIISFSKKCFEKREQCIRFISKLNEFSANNPQNSEFISQLQNRTTSILNYIDNSKKLLKSLETEHEKRIIKFGNKGLLSNPEFLSMLKKEIKITEDLYTNLPPKRKSEILPQNAKFTEEGVRFDYYYYEKFKTSFFLFIEQIKEIYSKYIIVMELFKLINPKLTKKNTFIDYFTLTCASLLGNLENNILNSEKNDECYERFDKDFQFLLNQASALHLFIHHDQLKKIGIHSIESSEFMTHFILKENYIIILDQIMDFKKEYFPKHSNFKERKSAIENLLNSFVL